MGLTPLAVLHGIVQVLCGHQWLHMPVEKKLQQTVRICCLDKLPVLLKRAHQTDEMTKFLEHVTNVSLAITQEIAVF